MIDPAFRNINRLFVQLFKVGENDPTGNSFVKYYMPPTKIKDFSLLIGNKPLLINP